MNVNSEIFTKGFLPMHAKKKPGKMSVIKL